MRRGSFAGFRLRRGGGGVALLGPRRPRGAILLGPPRARPRDLGQGRRDGQISSRLLIWMVRRRQDLLVARGTHVGVGRSLRDLGAVLGDPIPEVAVLEELL